MDRMIDLLLHTEQYMNKAFNVDKRSNMTLDYADLSETQINALIDFIVDHNKECKVKQNDNITTFEISHKMKYPTIEEEPVAINNWSDLEHKFNIKFILKNGKFRPVNEWLDDLYLLYTPDEVKDIITTIMINGDKLFKDIKKHQE